MKVQEFKDKADGIINDFTGFVSNEAEFKNQMLTLLLDVCYHHLTSCRECERKGESYCVSCCYNYQSKFVQKISTNNCGMK